MGFFDNKNKVVPTESQSSVLQNQFASARHNLLLVVGFTVINIILLVTNSNTYFLFSAFIPYFLGDMGMYLCGKYPAEYYGEDMASSNFLGNGIFAIFIGVAVAVIALYLLCWVLSKKQKVGFIIAALVLFFIDTLALFFIGGISVDLIMDYIFHIWVIVILFRGVFAYYKLQKLPPEENAVEDITEEAVGENI
ncbi:MAG: hypothetical protein J6A78_03005 [Clostridia bacterium]|nr:hypothetical protein [Clostridia bacterium]